jgi:hypothetical protein
MSIRTRSMISLVWFAAAALSLPAMADGVPGARHAKSKSHREAPMTTAARKPNDSGVTLQYRLDAVPQVGHGTPIVLQFSGVTEQDGATVRFSAGAGLTISGSDTLTVPAGKQSSATVTVVSEGEGRAYLNVFITQGGAMSAIAIPVQTGASAPALKSSGELKTTPEGENIIMMPAK